jgi:hypothetical protein
VSRHQWTWGSIKGLLWGALVDQENPCRPATPPTQQHNHHSISHLRSHTHHCEQSQQSAPAQFTLLMSWAPGGIITTKPNQQPKFSNHGHLNKIKPQQQAGQAPRRCRAGKEEVPSTTEVQGKPPGEEQSKYQEHLIKLKQEHHQHPQLATHRSQHGNRVYFRNCISWTKSWQGSRFLHKQHKQQDKKPHTTKPFYQVHYLGGFGVYFLRLTERCSL